MRKASNRRTTHDKNVAKRGGPDPNTPPTVFVGMSGGVDSSVTAYLLKNQGYNVVGVFMRCYNIDGCAEIDAEDARRVAESLSIPFYTWDFEEEYKKRVVEYMIEGYRAGLTPNPDVMCNREIKFGLFLNKAVAMGADYVATGHYVRKREETGSEKREANGQKAKSSRFPNRNSNYSLFSARDANKDQSYFLWALTQKEISRCLFPVGDLTKPEVRALAAKAGLSTAAKKDSQGICFLGQVSIADFLGQYIPAKKGEILMPNGEVVGQHNGAQFVTVGQRHIGGNFQFPVLSSENGKKEDTKPHYVVAKNVKTNTITIAEGRDNPLLFKKTLKLTSVNIINQAAAGGSVPLPVFARVRYRQPLSPATLIYAARTKSYTLEFAAPQQFVAEGQSAVWYSREGEMLGGGVIKESA